MLYLRALGEPRLESAEGPLAVQRKDLALLIHLAHRSPRRVARAELAALLWGDREDARARHSLRQSLVRLKRWIGPGLEVDRATVRLIAGAVELDTAGFEADIAAGRLEAAVSRWNGEFAANLEDAGSDSFRTWVEQQRAALGKQLELTFERLVAQSRGRGDAAAAIRHASQWAERFPYDQRAHASLTAALRVAGRDAEAHVQEATFALRLAELGETLSPEFAELVREAEAQGARSRLAGTPVETRSVDHEPELRLLVARWRSVSAGGAAGVLIEGGEPASRSQLCQELVTSLAVAGEPALVLRAVAEPDGVQTPLSFASRLFAPLRSAPGLSGAPDDALALVSTLVPSIRERFSRLPHTSTNGSELDVALRRVLTDVAAELPILVVADDVGRCDAASRDLLVTLARTPPAGVLVVLTASVAAGASAPDWSVLALRNEPAVQHIDLGSAGEPVLAGVAAARDYAAVDPRRSWQAGRANLFRTATAIAGVGAVALIGSIALSRAPADTFTATTIAVARIEDRTGGASRDAAALPDMLTTALAQIPGLELVSTTRVREIAEQLRAAGHADTTFDESARRAGAAALLEGELYRSPGGLRLDLRWRDLGTGAVRHAYSTSAPTPFEVVRRVADELRESVDAPPALRGATFHTTSQVAYRFYEEGLRAFYQGDAHTAHRLFQAALAEDTSFAAAAYYLYRSLEPLGLSADYRVLDRAARLAERAPDRERLIIRAAWADARNEPSALAVAETLAIRYPTEPDGHYLLGRALVWSGRFLEAIPHLRRAVAMDTVSLRGLAARCPACDALADIANAYIYADSMRAAERTLRAWTRAQPRAARPWALLAGTLEYLDRYDEALAARRIAAPLQPGHRIDPIYPALVSIRAANFDAADALLRERIENGPPDVQGEAMWFLAISLRTQGRLREALQQARALRAREDSARRAPGPPYTAVLEAQVMFELGRYRRAAALFDSISTTPQFPGWRAQAVRQYIWMQAHRATALAAAGDTARLARIAAAIEPLGPGSGFGRDRRLHHYVRGLLYALRGEHAIAVTEFEQAMFSSNGTNFTRINLALARSLLALGRGSDAVRVLQPVFRGPLEAGNLYATRTEFHVALGDAFRAAARIDSAAVHYRRALAAWQNADPELVPHREQVRARLDSLTAADNSKPQ
jgi:DNA-binding SARP family transcriptional activator/tetratricopeptide (TPR) repeat protein